MNAPLVFAALDGAGEPRVLAALRRRADGRLAALLDADLLAARPSDAEWAPGVREVARLGHCSAPPPRGWEALFDGVAHADSLPARPGLGALRPVDLVFLGASPDAEALHGTPWYAPGGGRYAPRLLCVHPEGAAAWIDGERGAIVALGQLTESERNLAELVAEAWSEPGAPGPIARWCAAAGDGAEPAQGALERVAPVVREALYGVLCQGRGGSLSLGEGQQLDVALTHEEGGFALDLARRTAGSETQLLRLGLARFGSLAPVAPTGAGSVLVFERPLPLESVLTRICDLVPFLVELCAGDALHPDVPREPGPEEGP